MIKSISGMTMISECHVCKRENSTDLNGKTVRKNEFDQWDTFNVVCPCGSAFAYNLGISDEDIDKDLATGDVSANFEVCRHYVRLLIRIVREDWKE